MKGRLRPEAVGAGRRNHLFHGALSSRFAGRNFMPLVTIVLVLIAVGVVLWLINTYIPMQGTIKGILNAVVVIAVVIWLLQVFGLLGNLTSIHVGR
jgi:hypothetical protein